MATLKITDGTTTIDLINGPFMLADAGWEAESSDEVVWDTITCLVRGTADEIRAEQNRIDKLAIQAQRYFYDIKENTAVLLKVAGEGEDAKQVVVIDIRAKYHSDSNMTPLLVANAADGDTLQMVTLAVLHTPYFEPDLDLVSYSAQAVGNVSDLGGTWEIGDAGGTLDQRIASFVISDDSSPSYEHNKFWIGIRRLRYGTADFQPVWEVEAASEGTDTTGGIDATASSGFSATCNFGTTTTLAERLQFLVEQFSTGQPADMIGEYLVLGRVKLSSAATEVHIQLKQGHLAYGTLTQVAGDTYLSAVTDSNLTNWNLVELGHIQIPTTGNRESIANEATGLSWFGLSLLAERMSASGSLVIDCLVLIPTDYYFTATDCRVGAGIDELQLITSNLNEQIALGSTPNSGALGGVRHYSVNFSFNNWFYPADGGILVIAGQKTAQHDLSQTLDLSIELCPRWPLFRV